MNVSSIYEHLFRSFGLNANPFKSSPDPRFLFPGQAYETAIAELMFGTESRRGLMVLTGEAGTGKTTLARYFLQWLKDRHFSSSYVFHTHLHATELFEVILRDFDIPVTSAKKSTLLGTLQHWLEARQRAGDSPVVIIDEAQALSIRAMSELLQLLNFENSQGKLLQVILVGQPELDEKLRRPELRSLRQRIMVRCRLPLLTLEQTNEYISSRLRGAGGSGQETFPLEAIQALYSFARGIPRVINLLCEHSLIGAYADGSAIVSTANVCRAAAEFDLVDEPLMTLSMDLQLNPGEAPKKSSVPSVVPENQDALAVELKSIDETLAAVLPPRRDSEKSAGSRPLQVTEQKALPVAVAAAEVIPIATSFATSGAASARTDILFGDLRLVDFWRASDAQPDFSNQAVELTMRKNLKERARRRYWRDVTDSFNDDLHQFLRSTRSACATYRRSVLASLAAARQRSYDSFCKWLGTPVIRSRRHANTARGSHS